MKKGNVQVAVNKQRTISITLLICVAVVLTLSLAITGAWFFSRSSGETTITFGQVKLGSQTVNINTKNNLLPTDTINVNDISYSSGSADAWYRVSVQITGIEDLEEVTYSYGQISGGQTISINSIKIPSDIGDDYQNQSALLQIVVEVIQKEGIPVGEHNDIVNNADRLSAQAKDAFVYAGYEFIKLPAVNEPTPTPEKLTFTLNSAGTGYVVKAASTSITGDVVIPSTYQGKPVTEVADKGFMDCASITSVSFPTSLTKIGMGSFVRCSQLTTMNIPDNVTFVGYGFVQNCHKLVSVRFSRGMTKIERNMFYNCYALKHVYIPDTVTEMDRTVFSGASGIEYVHLPDSITKIGEATFNNCTALKYVNFPDNLSSLGEQSFTYCLNLETVDLTCKLSTLPKNTFGGCTIKYLEIPENIKTIATATFNQTTITEYLNFSSELNQINLQGMVWCDIGEINFAQVDSCTLTDTCFYESTIHSELYIPNNYNLTNDYINNKNGSNGQFATCDIPSFRLDSTNTKYMTVDGVIYSRKSTDPTSADFNIPIHLEAMPGGKAEVTIPYTVTSIRRYEGAGPKIVRILVENGPNGEPHPTFSSEDGILYDDTGKCLLQLPAGRNDISFTVKEGVTNLGGMDGSTSGYGGVGSCRNLQYLYFPKPFLQTPNRYMLKLILDSMNLPYC